MKCQQIFLNSTWKKRKKKYSKEQIRLHLKNCVFDLTIDNMDKFVIQLEMILKEYCDLNTLMIF